jgi:hypothetical protein
MAQQSSAPGSGGSVFERFWGVLKMSIARCPKLKNLAIRYHMHLTDHVVAITMKVSES